MRPYAGPERIQIVVRAAQTLGETFTVRDIVHRTGIQDFGVRAALEALERAGFVTGRYEPERRPRIYRLRIDPEATLEGVARAAIEMQRRLNGRRS